MIYVCNSVDPRRGIRTGESHKLMELVRACGVRDAAPWRCDADVAVQRTYKYFVKNKNCFD